MAQWSLRTKLVVVAAIALLPVLALSAGAPRRHSAAGNRRAEAAAAASGWRHGDMATFWRSTTVVDWPKARGGVQQC